MLSALKRRVDDDSGIGMILVIGIMAIVAGLTVLGATIAQNALGQTKHRINFERALASAESGIDFALGHLQYAYDEEHLDFPIPKKLVAPTTACTADAVPLPDLGVVDERSWAVDRLRELARDHKECLMNTPEGQVMVLKPANPVGGAGIQYGRVYAMGWSPGLGKVGAVSRTIKVEYVFMPYKPEFAILTGTSPLTLNSTSTDVMGAYDVDPRLASVHTNGNLTVIGQPSVSGDVTYSGDLDVQGSTNGFRNDTATPQDPVRIPRVSALAFYRQANDLDPKAMGNWFDLCPGGVVRTYAGNVPCTGAELDAAPFRGWSYTQDTSAGTRVWTASADTANGTYFVHEADVENGNGNGPIENITVIASSSGTTCTDKRYGNITWDHYDTLAPAFKNLFFLADGDLSATANFYSGQSSPGNVVSGMYVAGEEVLLWTSSSGLVGSVLAGNKCESEPYGLKVGGKPLSTNEVQGQIIKFDPNGDSPFSSLISTTLWLEY